MNSQQITVASSPRTVVSSLERIVAELASISSTHDPVIKEFLEKNNIDMLPSWQKLSSAQAQLIEFKNALSKHVSEKPRKNTYGSTSKKYS